jgi:hypothetical protein
MLHRANLPSNGMGAGPLLDGLPPPFHAACARPLIGQFEEKLHEGCLMLVELQWVRPILFPT